MKWLRWLCALVLGGIFLSSGLLKAGASEQFALAIIGFDLIPPRWAPWAAGTLSLLEVILGLAVLWPRTQRWAAGALMALCGLFIFVIARALSYGWVVDCFCFGSSDLPTQGKMILAIGRDVLLIGLCAVLLKRSNIPGSSQKNRASA